MGHSLGPSLDPNEAKAKSGCAIYVLFSKPFLWSLPPHRRLWRPLVRGLSGKSGNSFLPSPNSTTTNIKMQDPPKDFSKCLSPRRFVFHLTILVDTLNFLDPTNPSESTFQHFFLRYSYLSRGLPSFQYCKKRFFL